MGGELKLQVEATYQAAHSVAAEAEALTCELESIDGQWAALSAKWIGQAGSAFESAWRDWYEDARVVAAVLVEHSELLVKSAAMFVEHENEAAAQLGNLHPGGAAL
jgi:WXG100 family type VII secretion target